MVIGWAVVLIAAAVYAARNGQPTVREQTTVVQALPTLDRAIAAVATTAGPTAVATVTGYERTVSRCEAGNRTGVEYERSLSVYTIPGQEAQVVDRIAAALPRSYRATVRHSGSTHALRADAGFFVRLTGALVRQGELRFTAETGCRVPGGEIPGPVDEAGAPPAPATAATEALARLDGAQPARRTYRLECPAGGVKWFVEFAATVPAETLSIASPPGAQILLSGPDRLAFLDGEVGVVVTAFGGRSIVSATTPCG